MTWIILYQQFLIGSEPKVVRRERYSRRLVRARHSNGITFVSFALLGSPIIQATLHQSVISTESRITRTKFRFSSVWTATSRSNSLVSLVNSFGMSWFIGKSVAVVIWCKRQTKPNHKKRKEIRQSRLPARSKKDPTETMQKNFGRKGFPKIKMDPTRKFLHDFEQDGNELRYSRFRILSPSTHLSNPVRMPDAYGARWL